MKKRLSIFTVILAAVFWGTTSLFVKALASYGFDSLQISCIRMFFSALFMSSFIFFKDKKLFKISFKDTFLFILLGIVSVFLTSVF